MRSETKLAALAFLLVVATIAAAYQWNRAEKAIAAGEVYRVAFEELRAESEEYLKNSVASFEAYKQNREKKEQIVGAVSAIQSVYDKMQGNIEQDGVITTAEREAIAEQVRKGQSSHRWKWGEEVLQSQ